MPMHLEGGCRCGAVSFAVDSHTPYPYQLCYCSICRKTAGGGGYAINVMGRADSLAVRGAEAIAIYHARLAHGISTGERRFCRHCATALWIGDADWPDLVHPFASAIDTDLPVPPSRVHMMLRYKAGWVVPQLLPDDECFDEYSELSIEDWHRRHGLWVE